MKDALQVIEQNRIEDSRLLALIYAYLGRIHNEEGNFENASDYYEKAICAEIKNQNFKNLIIDYCDLISCYVAAGNNAAAKSQLAVLDSLCYAHQDIRLIKPYSTKAIYYLHGVQNLDSALYYCKKSIPAVNESSHEKQLATIYQRLHLTDSAIVHEKRSYEKRQVQDSIWDHVYYKGLASLYEQQGCSDSSAHYALLAYQSLHDVQEQRTEKRILELEKRYDVAAREAALEKTRHQRNLLIVVVCALILLLASFLRQLYMQKRRQAAEKMTKDVIHAAAKTHQNTLSQLNELRKKPKSRTVQSLQEDIGDIARDLRRGFSENFSKALSENIAALPPEIRKSAEKLSGERSKIVYILSELGYEDSEIAEFTCTSSDSVRTINNNNKKLLRKDNGFECD